MLAADYIKSKEKLLSPLMFRIEWNPFLQIATHHIALDWRGYGLFGAEEHQHSGLQGRNRGYTVSREMRSASCERVKVSRRFQNF